MTDVEILVRLSQIDPELLRVKKSLDELPEAAQIMECRAKRKELKAKQDQVIELTDDVEQKMAKLQLEETQVIEKIKELQDVIDHSSDYRVTSAATRDMNGQLKRQQSLAQEQDELLERQIKIDHLGDQVMDLLAKLDHKEHHLTEGFKEKGGALRQQIQDLTTERDQLASQLAPALRARYQKVRDEKGGLGVALFAQGACSVCRTQIQPGQLARLKEGPQVTECPNCHRLFVMEH